MTPILAVSFNNSAGMARLRSSVEHCDVPVYVYEHNNSIANIGYTAGMNRLIGDLLEDENPEYFIIASHDVQFRPGSIEALHEFMRTHPACGIAGCKQLLTANPDYIWHGGTGPAVLGMHLLGSVARGDYSVSAPMTWVNGAAAIVRTAAARQVGLMDDQFFLFGSDSDWCYRFRLKKWQVWYCAEAEVLHDTGISDKQTDEIAEICAQDMRKWREKWEAVTKTAKGLTRARSVVDFMT